MRIREFLAYVVVVGAFTFLALYSLNGLECWFRAPKPNWCQNCLEELYR